MRAGDYRVAWNHTIPTYYKKKEGAPKGAVKVSNKSYVVPGKTICYIMKFEKGDKTDPTIVTSECTQYVGKAEKYVDVTEIFRMQGVAIPPGSNVYTKTEKEKGDIFSKEQGRVESLKKALKIGLEDGSLTGPEVSEIFKAYNNRKNDSNKSKK